MAKQSKYAGRKKVLVVEGYSDLLFVAEVLEFLGKDQEVNIEHFNGSSDILGKLEAFLTPELLVEKESIGILIDADNNVGNSIKSLKSAIERATNRAIEHGEWSVQQGEARIGFFVVPDGGEAGEIETLAWNAWANDVENATAKKCIESYLNCMSGLGFMAKSPDKGRISALLAIKNDDDPRLGPGARAKVFDFYRPEYEPLMSFLKGL